MAPAPLFTHIPEEFHLDKDPEIVEIVIALFVVAAIVYFLKPSRTGTSRERASEQETEHRVAKHEKADKAPQNVAHSKKEHLTTPNERKLFFALQKALDENHVIHCQVSLIALVQPVNFKDNSKSWAKRMDFVITDTATKIIAVIELDDSSHLAEKRKKRDAYVNNALKGHHPLIRLSTKKFYDPREIAIVLEREAGIRNKYHVQESPPSKHGTESSNP